MEENRPTRAELRLGCRNQVSRSVCRGGTIFLTRYNFGREGLITEESADRGLSSETRFRRIDSARPGTNKGAYELDIVSRSILGYSRIDFEPHLLAIRAPDRCHRSVWVGNAFFSSRGPGTVLLSSTHSLASRIWPRKHDRRLRIPNELNLLPSLR